MNKHEICHSSQSESLLCCSQATASFLQNTCINSHILSQKIEQDSAVHFISKCNKFTDLQSKSQRLTSFAKSKPFSSFVFNIINNNNNNNNKFNICIAWVPYGNAHPRVTIIQIKIKDKVTIV